MKFCLKTQNIAHYAKKLRVFKLGNIQIRIQHPQIDQNQLQKFGHKSSRLYVVLTGVDNEYDAAQADIELINAKLNNYLKTQRKRLGYTVSRTVFAFN